ncbi:putative methylmalonyl-CoA epimerase [Gordonia araii NBRC 100433]|uniref:Putative methylmalonyl-CoA epimerase n=1 Tax=Gordonia araii NBRC 100433 TaxID=1073574 RepID=G7GX26_9ACTN|nr:methylmalonyl-CoA epimerase [Gordonia araii]NNG99146.1 methylmalonyl-CoA epimerase [Gordonia araii NBRC 100433]GAB08151.1 putative methylmalonyl-CoA epimerase [Gordonia araii NBRC 100433]
MSTSPTALISDLVTGIDHVGIAVPDLPAAQAWYEQHLGFVTLHEEVNEEQGVREAMVGPKGGAGAVIQLLAPLNDDSTIAKFLDRQGPGLQQLAVRVTDLDAVVARLTAAGLRVLYPEARRGTADSRINFVHPRDAGGVLLELVEPATTGH